MSVKKILFFLLISNLFFRQKTEVIDLLKSIKDSKGTIKTFTVIDQRPDKEVGSVIYHKSKVNIIFENELKIAFATKIKN